MSAYPSDDRMPADVSALRIPPHAIDAEQSVLGALMLDPSALPRLSDWLSEQDFYRKDHRLIWRALTGLIDRGSPVDAVTMEDWFQSNGLIDMIGRGYLLELSNGTASSANIVAYAEIIAEKSRLRSLIDIGTGLAESAWGNGADSQQAIADAMHTLSTMQASKLRGGLESVKGVMGRLWSLIEERYQQGPGLLGQPWPWKDLNECTKGLRDRVLYVVGARPSMGKSIFGLQAAAFTALRGQRVAYFSVEMGAEEAMARAVACIGEIPHDWVEHPDDKHSEAEIFWPRMHRSIKALRECDLLIDETPAISAQQMMARARRAHMQKPIRLVVVDHMHDMLIDPAKARFDYGVITQMGKTMAKEFGCPVILLAQLNRASSSRADKRPTMTDLRESGEIEQKADVILFLHREDYYQPNEMKGVVEVIPAKGRNIRTGKTIYLENTFSEMRLQDWVGPLPVSSAEEQPIRRGLGSRGR